MKNQPTIRQLKIEKYLNSIIIFWSFNQNRFTKEMSYHYFKTQYTHYH
jgi:hypothetical protein